MMKTTIAAVKNNSSPNKDFKEIETKYCYTQPRYMNAINASMGFGIAAIFPYIIVRMIMGNDFGYSIISYMAAAGVIFLLAWNFLMRPWLLSAGTKLKWKPYTSHYPPMILGTLCWTPIFICIVRVADGFVKSMEAISAADGNLLTNTIAKLYLGTLFGAPYGTDAGFINTVIAGAVIAVVYLVFMYFFCCSDGTPIAEMKRFIPGGSKKLSAPSYRTSPARKPVAKRSTEQYCDTVHTEGIYAEGSDKIAKIWEREEAGHYSKKKDSSHTKNETHNPSPVQRNTRKPKKDEVDISPVFRRRR